MPQLSERNFGRPQAHRIFVGLHVRIAKLNEMLLSHHDVELWDAIEGVRKDLDRLQATIGPSRPNFDISRR